MNLRAYLKTIPMDERPAFAARCGTTIGYLKKWLSAGGTLGPAIAIGIERESGGVVRVEELAPHVDWGYIRNTGSDRAAA